VDNVAVDDNNEITEIQDDIVNKFDNCEGQQRRTMMNRFMTNVNSSTSMYWKEDLPMRNKNINNKFLNMNMSNSSNKNSMNNNIKNNSIVNNIVDRKSMDQMRNVNVNNRSIKDKDSTIENSNSCLTTLSVKDKDELDESTIFSPSGSKKKKVEQQHVVAILNDDYERFQNDNTTKNIMNLNNDSENDVLSRSIINANTNVCSNEFSALSIPKDVVDNNLGERFQYNNTKASSIRFEDLPMSSFFL
jgi:hypothetical protein